MDADTVPGNDEIVMMPSAELESLAQALDVRRRIAEAEAALLVQRVEATGMHTVDGRDERGMWHTFRPDGSEIGWPVLRYRHEALPNEVAAA